MLSYEFVILEVNGAGCEFALDDIYWDGGGTVSVIEGEFGNTPTRFSLNNNFPNPFNPITNIRYDLPEASYIDLRVFDLAGREVRTLVRGFDHAGEKSVVWDAKDNNGRSVSAGVYIYRLETAGQVQSQKLILLK